MKHLLLVEPSEVFRSALVHLLDKKYRLTACGNGETALELLRELRPDILLIDLELPGLEGLEVLRLGSGHMPQIILALTGFISPYVQQRAKDLGISYIMRTPCRADAVAFRVTDLVHWYSSPHPAMPDPQAITAAHLQRLSFPIARDGTNQLRVGIPLFAQDPGQRLGKELYASICELLGAGTPQTVEHSIRVAIEAAYAEGSQAVWAEYFPPDGSGNVPCPTNRVFITRLAVILSEAWELQSENLIFPGLETDAGSR